MIQNKTFEFLKITELSETQLRQLSEMLIEHIESDYVKVYPPVVIKSFLLNTKIDTLIKRFSDGRETLFCLQNDDLIGTVSILKNEVRTFHVKQELRGQGIGREMIEILKTKMTKNILKVKSLLTAQSTYLKLGFKISHYEKVKTEKTSTEYDVAVMFLNINLKNQHIQKKY